MKRRFGAVVIVLAVAATAAAFAVTNRSTVGVRLATPSATAVAVGTSSPAVIATSSTPESFAPVATEPPPPSLSPTPVPTPPPWWAAFPPNPPIASVPLQKDSFGFSTGSIYANTSSYTFPKHPNGNPVNPAYQFLGEKEGTLVAIVPERKTGILWIAVTVAGRRISNIHFVRFTNYGRDGAEYGTVSYMDRVSGGATFWYAIGPHTEVWLRAASQTPGSTRVGRGPMAFVGRLRIGMPIFDIYITFAPHKGGGWGRLTASDARINMASLARLKRSVGVAYPRSNRIFSFVPDAIQILDEDLPAP